MRARSPARGEMAALAGLGVLLVLCTAVSVGWLTLGAVAAVAQYWPPVNRAVAAAAAQGSSWALAIAEAAQASEPLGQAVLDYGFSLLNLVLAGVLLGAGVRRAEARSWSIRLLAVALVGSAGAFNLQAHAAGRAVESVTGLAVNGVHQVVLHSIACAAYIMALLVFPTPSSDGLPGGRPARDGLAVVGALTLLLVGLGTALLPHTISCVLFFGFLVPVVGLVVLPRRVRRGPGADLRTQARLLLTTLVGCFVVAVVLGIVTLVVSVVNDAPVLPLIDPTAPGTAIGSAAPFALLFWFSRLASAAIAVVVLVATRHDRLWTAERRFSRALAVLLAAAVGGGGFVVLRAIATGVIGPGGAIAVATVAVTLGLGPLYVRAARLVDRLLYGTRPAPYSALAGITALSHSATGQAPDLQRVAEAVALGLGAETCRLTVLRPGLRDRTYEWTDRSPGSGADDLLEVPIDHGDERVGAIAVDRQAVSGLNVQRDRLLNDIAESLGVVLEASRSGIELERQLRAALAHAREIAVSRRQTVAEMDGERRRIERDLHDGAQHHLVSLHLTLGLVEHQVGVGELGQARESLRRLTEQLDTAEAVLAATADGVSSLALSEQGLVAALRAELGAVHPPIGFDAGGVPPGRRYPAEVEAAVWFCCSESVGNARKHAPGAPVTVRLAERVGALRFVVCDEGPGFAVEEAGFTGGRGVRNMTTRISAVGGMVAIRSTPGVGTTVEGSVPLPRDAAPAPAPARPPAPDREAAALVPSAMNGAARLDGQVREVACAACGVYRDSPVHGRVDELAHRIDEPVRIAVLATAEPGRRMLVEALIGMPAVPRRPDVGPLVPVRFTYGIERVGSEPDGAVVMLPAPALRAMTVVDVPTSDSGDPGLPDRVRALLGTVGGDAPAADAFVLLLRDRWGANQGLLDLFDGAGQRGAIGVLLRADAADDVAERAVEEYGYDPAVRRVCQAVVSVAPAIAVAASHLGDEEYRLLRRWAAGTDSDPTVSLSGDAPQEMAAVVERLGPAGARWGLELVRRGEGDTRAELSAALLRHSGLAALQELVATRFVGRAVVLRSRSVLAGLDAVLRASPPAGEDARRLRYQLERVRAGAHELREAELLDALRSGELPLPDDELRAAERLLGAHGGDVRARLGLGLDSTAEEMRAEAARQPARWRKLAAQPVASVRLREAAEILVRTCERLLVEVDDSVVPR